MNEIPTFAPGCGFLSTADLQAAIDGRLAPARQDAFDRHIEGDCAECITLATDIATFRRLVTGGVLESERREQEIQAEPLRALLREAVRKRKTTRT